MRCYIILFLTAFYCKVVAQQLVVPLGHSGFVRTAAFSSDNQLLVTGSVDRTAIVWETFSGRKIHDLAPNKSAVTYAFFSPDNRFIVVGTDSSICVWSVPGYKIVYTSPVVSGALFSSSGRNLFTVDFAGTIRQLRLDDFKVEFSYKDSALPQSLVTDSAGRYLCSNTASAFTVRDTKTGKRLAKSNVKGELLGCGFLPDNNYLLAVSRSGMQRFDASREFAALSFIDQPAGEIYWSSNRRFLLIAFPFQHTAGSLWDLKEYREIFNAGDVRAVPDSVPKINPLTGDIDGYTLLDANSRYEFPKFFRDMTISNTGKWIGFPWLLFNTKNYNQSVSMTSSGLRLAAFTSDSKYLAVQLEEGICGLLETGSGEIIQRYTAGAANIRFVDMAADGNYFVVAGYDSTARIVETATATTLSTLKGHTAMVTSAVFNTAGTELLTNSMDSSAKRWDLKTGQLIQTYPQQVPAVNPAWYNRDDSVITSPIPYDSIAIYDLDGNFQKDTVILRETETPDADHHWISRSGRYLLKRMSDGGAAFYDRFGESHFYFRPPVSLVAFSPDEKYLAVSDIHNDTLTLVEIESGKIISARRPMIDSAPTPSGRHTLQLLFTNRYLLEVDGTGKIHFYFPKTGKEVFRLPGYSCAVSADFKKMVVANQGEADIYDLEQNKLLYRYISVDQDNYLVMDSLFRFDGTDQARKSLYYVCGNEIITLDQVKNSSWETALAAKLTGASHKKIAAKPLSQLDICNRLPLVKTIPAEPALYKFSITPQQGPIGEVQLYVNGKFRDSYSPAVLPRRGNSYELTVRRLDIQSYLDSGSRNEVTVKATTAVRSDVLSSAAAVQSTEELEEIRKIINRVPANIYLLSVGISRYGDTSLDLNFPETDAASMAAMLKMAGRKLLEADNRSHVYTWTLVTSGPRGDQPTKTRIQAALDTIRQRATARDLVILFFAGHGMGAIGENNLLLPTMEAASAKQVISSPETYALSFRELATTLRNVKAKKEIVILDVCNAGAAEKELVEGFKENGVQTREIPGDQQKAVDNLASQTGCSVLMAAAEGQRAYETSLYNHGVLTAALLQAIKQRTGLRDDKFILADHWFTSAIENVAAIANIIQRPQTPLVFGTARYDIGLADQQVSDSIVLQQQRKIFAELSVSIEGPNHSDAVLGLSVLLKNKMNIDMMDRGGNPFYFSPDNSSPDAYRLTGSYSVTGSVVKVFLFLSTNKLQGEPIYHFEVDGSIAEKERIADEIILKLTNYLKN
ncbi:MAG: caspase family protein [Chitinophagaceae bacterium]